MAKKFNNYNSVSYGGIKDLLTMFLLKSVYDTDGDGYIDFERIKSAAATSFGTLTDDTTLSVNLGEVDTELTSLQSQITGINAVSLSADNIFRGSNIHNGPERFNAISSFDSEVYINNGAGATFEGFDSETADYKIWANASADKFHIGVYGNPAITIDPTGKVGIFNSSPSDALDVGANATFSETLTGSGTVDFTGASSATVSDPSGSTTEIDNVQSRIAYIKSFFTAGYGVNCTVRDGSDVSLATASANYFSIIDPTDGDNKIFNLIYTFSIANGTTVDIHSIDIPADLTTILAGGVVSGLGAATLRAIGTHDGVTIEDSSFYYSSGEIVSSLQSDGSAGCSVTTSTSSVDFSLTLMLMFEPAL